MNHFKYNCIYISEKSFKYHIRVGGGMDELKIKDIFEDIVRKYYSRLLSYIRIIVKNDASAQDVVQETFISAYKSWNDYSEQGKIFSWLKIIAKNTAYRYIQKESKYACVSLSESVKGYDDGEEINLAGYIADDAMLEDSFIANEGYNRILEVINNLPEHQRKVFYYRFIENMSVSEVALKLNIAQGSVKSKTYYGMAKVKSELKNYLIEGDYIMDCKKTYEYLYQYANDAILQNDKENVEKHLEVCKDCKDITDSLKKLIPQIKPAPEGIMRHYNIAFQVDDGMILGYFGIKTRIENFKKLNEVLDTNNGEIPKGETWFYSGFGSKVQHLAEFDNEGNRIEVEIFRQDNGHQNIKYKKMKKVFEYHETNSVSLSEDSYGEYKKSPDAPNLYIAQARNNLGTSARSGLYIAIPGKATNVRMKQGVDVTDCGTYKFAYDDRYVTESQPVIVECTYNM